MPHRYGLCILAKHIASTWYWSGDPPAVSPDTDPIPLGYRTIAGGSLPNEHDKWMIAYPHELL